MECPHTKWLSNGEYLMQLNHKILQQRIPVSGTIGLTYRCNLRCVHCFLGERSKIRDNASRELTTLQWRRILDQITEAGCLNLTFTGGEPLLREDFAELYLHAKKNGLLVTIFSNGTLFSPALVELFAEWPPRLVDISLYGASAESYERISGSKNAYQSCLEGMQALRRHGIAVSVKTVLMSHNAHELDDMKNIAEKLGAHFRFDPIVLPGLTGDTSPLNLRIPPNEVVEKEFSEQKHADLWKSFFDKRKEFSAQNDKLYQCGSGLNSFYIDPFGSLQGCLMASSPSYKVLEGSFSRGWYEVIPRIRQKKIIEDSACNHCDKLILCGYCPALVDPENVMQDASCEYRCALGQQRLERIQTS